jgi:hypothetical protein
MKSSFQQVSLILMGLSYVHKEEDFADQSEDDYDDDNFDEEAPDDYGC